MSLRVTPLTPAHRGGAGPPLVLLHGFLDSYAQRITAVTRGVRSEATR